MDEPKTSHVVMTISCPHCHQIQIVQVRARTGASQMSEQAISCVKCKLDFAVMLVDQIVGGPFFPHAASGSS